MQKKKKKSEQAVLPMSLVLVRDIGASCFVRIHMLKRTSNLILTCIARLTHSIRWPKIELKAKEFVVKITGNTNANIILAKKIVTPVYRAMVLLLTPRRHESA